MAIRIIGGEYGGRHIDMPKSDDIRPTQDKVRQAIFNIIGPVEDLDVLELFAGSGAFGIEALSRGARHVTFVDNNFRCIDTIKKNLELLKIPAERYLVLRQDGLSVPQKSANLGKRYHMIFLDPPYYIDMARKCLINIDAYDIVAPIGIVIAEHFKKDTLAAELKTIGLEDERKYGDTIVSIFRRKV